MVARDAARARHVEVAGVADDHDVEVASPRGAQPRLAREDAQRAAQPGASHGRLALDDLDAGRTHRGNRIDVPRVLAVVRAEVERPHGPGGVVGAVVVGVVSVVVGNTVVVGGGGTVVVGSGAAVVVGWTVGEVAGAVGVGSVVGAVVGVGAVVAGDVVL